MARQAPVDGLTIRVEPVDKLFARAKESVGRIDRGDLSPETATLSFATPAQLLQALTPNRWNLVAMSRRIGPSSVRALSKALARDYRGVHADVAALLELGLVERGDDGKVFAPWGRITTEFVFEEAA